jgi:hypothetical protein
LLLWGVGTATGFDGSWQGSEGLGLTSRGREAEDTELGAVMDGAGELLCEGIALGGKDLGRLFCGG